MTVWQRLNGAENPQSLALVARGVSGCETDGTAGRSVGIKIPVPSSQPSVINGEWKGYKSNKRPRRLSLFVLLSVSPLRPALGENCPEPRTRKRARGADRSTRGRRGLERRRAGRQPERIPDAHECQGKEVEAIVMRPGRPGDRHKGGQTEGGGGKTRKLTYSLTRGLPRGKSRVVLLGWGSGSAPWGSRRYPNVTRCGRGCRCLRLCARVGTVD